MSKQKSVIHSDELIPVETEMDPTQTEQRT